MVCETIKKRFLKHATARLNPSNVAVSVFCDNPSTFYCSRKQTISALVGPHSRNVVETGAIVLFREKQMCTLLTVLCDFGGLSTTTILFANVPLVNRQLSWREESAQQHWYHQ